jgi:NAD(P)-dependent dehydrogenase (short-subunit alcohol dehydrogenase family)
MGDRLKGKPAIVTGAGRGIGRELCLALAAEGAKVVVVDPGASRDGKAAGEASPADEVVAEIKKAGGTAIADYSSVTDFKAAEGIVKRCVDAFGKVEILVNCAGILREKMLWNMPEEDFDAVLAVHLKGTFNMTRNVVGLMREQKSGRIINFTSTAWITTMGQSNYASAKGGIVSFTSAIANEMGKYGVTVNAVSPIAATRLTKTPEVEAGFKKRYESGLITKEQYEYLMDMPGPEFIPPMVVYLASDAAANINGYVLHITRNKAGIYTRPLEITIEKKEDGGMWTVDDLEKRIPSEVLTKKTLTWEYKNPSPPKPD